MTKLHITTETEEGQILKMYTFPIERNHYPAGLMPTDIQNMIDASFEAESIYNETVDKILDDEELRLEAQRLTVHND